MSKDEKIVHVFLNLSSPKVKVGTLMQKNKIIFFEYDDKFLKSTLEISPYMLPLKEGVFECSESTFWGVFNDSIPNSLEQLLLDQYLEQKNIDFQDITPLDKLCYIGNFTMGALSYKCKEKYNDFIVNDLFKITCNVLLKNNEENFIKLVTPISRLSRDMDCKMPIQYHTSEKTMYPISKSSKRDYSQIFVKFILPTDSIESGAIEMAYNSMALDAKLEIPGFFMAINKYFSYERYDYQKNKRLHVHSVAGLLYDDSKTSSLDYDDLLALTLHLTKDVREQEKVFRVACFNLFSSNRDDHAKNFSFTMDKNGIWKFAPSYNITFSNGLNGEHYTKYLGEVKNPTEKHLIDLGIKHMIKNSEKIIKEVKTSVSNWIKFANEVNLSEETSNLILSEISKRLN